MQCEPWMPCHALAKTVRKPASQPFPSEAQFLSSVTAISGGAFLTVGSSSRLEKNFVDILKEIKTRYLLTYYPQGEREEGWHDVRDPTQNRRAEVRARQGYYYTAEQDPEK